MDRPLHQLPQDDGVAPGVSPIGPLAAWRRRRLVETTRTSRRITQKHPSRPHYGAARHFRHDTAL